LKCNYFNWHIFGSCDGEKKNPYATLDQVKTHRSSNTGP